MNCFLRTRMTGTTKRSWLHSESVVAITVSLFMVLYIDCPGTALSDQKPPPSTLSTGTAVVSNIRMTTTVPIATKAGGQLDAVISITNQSTKQVGYLNQGYKGYATVLANVASIDGPPVELTTFGKHLYPTAGSEDQSSGGVVIKPGETEVIRVHLSRIYDLNTAGKYRLVAKLQIFNDTPLGFMMTGKPTDLASVEVISNRICIYKAAIL